MHTLNRKRALGAIIVVLAVGAGGPSTALVDSAAAKPKTRHCVKYKTVKTKKGTKVKRCAKYKTS